MEASARQDWRGLTLLDRVFQDMHGHLFPFLAIFFAGGVGLWFLQPQEPGAVHYAGMALLAVAAALAGWKGPESGRPFACAVAAVSMGYLAAGYRGHDVAAPMLGFRYYGAIEGRLLEVDRSQSDAVRLTLDEVRLEDVAPDRRPVRVRVSLQGEAPVPELVPGQTLMLTGLLAPPEGPVEPGSFDFRRMAYFDQLGAVGYTRNPVMILAQPEPGALTVHRVRMFLSRAIMARVPGDAGAFASGVLTGDRSGLSAEAVMDLRDSSLAHLLAISGMNLAFLVTFTFFLIRAGVALVPAVALRLPAKKIAAVLSMIVAFLYLMLSGANVATERAFIMVAVVLTAIVLDKRALTLRTASIAAMLILATKPESLVEPGFQMSFAATVALVAGFAAVDNRVLRERLPRWMIPVFTLVLSSVIGGFATAPYAAAHFNRFADLGLIANLLTVPVMGAVVMPAGIIAGLLALVGLSMPALWVMEQGARWILYVARTVADIDGSVTAIVAPMSAVLPLVSVGGLIIILWRGRWRWSGLAPCALALALWVQSDRPDLIIASDGKLLGLLGDEGRALSVAKGGGFSARSWLENDGDLADQATAALRDGFSGPASARQTRLAGVTVVSLRGKAGIAALQDTCATADLVIIDAVVENPPPQCRLIDLAILRQTGSLSLWTDDTGLRVERAKANRRLWTGPVGDAAVLPDHVGPQAITVAKAASDQ